MKKRIGKLIDFFAYKNPELWHTVNDYVFDLIDMHEQKARKKMHERIQKLLKKYKI